MPDGVKPTRRYDSQRRRQQAAATRLEILSAAQRLFEQHGYVATTMAAIAVEGGVSLKTVYLAFGTKSGVLRALWNLLLRGDESDTPMTGREWYRDVLAEPRPARQLRLAAQASRLVKVRVGSMFEVIRAASTTDPDIAVLWERIQAEFHALLRAVVASIDRKGALAPGLDVDHATDILWSLSHPSLWQLLVVQRGWTPEAYEDWCAETTCAQLLAGRPQPR